MRKKLLSFALCITLAITVVYTGGIGILPKVSASGGVSAEELENYRRITVADIVDGFSWYPYISHDGDGDDRIFTVNAAKEFTVDNGFGGKTYLDVDMNFGGSTEYGRYALSWQGNERYRNAFYLYMTDANTFALKHYDADQNLSTLCTAGTAYGISNSDYFNVKLATNIEKASADAATETVTWRCWVNDMYVDGGTFSEAAHDRKVFTTKSATANSLTMRVPKVLSEEFAGYQKVSISDFHAGDGSTIAISAQPAGMELTGSGVGVTQRYYNSAKVESADSYSLDKTYFDFDINLASSTTAPMLSLYERANWYSYLRIKFNNASNQLLLAYVDDNGSTVTSLGTYNLLAFGRTTSDEFFNIKVRADFSENASDPSTRDAVIQLWINNRFATEVELTGKLMKDGIWFRPGGETTYIREQKDMAEELAGYRRVDMFDFNKTISADGIVNFAVSDIATPYLNDFDKTYLDVDLNYGGETARGGAVFQYLAYAKWTNSLYLGFKDSDSTFILSKYDHVHNLTDLATLNASDFGISPSEYFNVKLRTDIETVSSSEYSVTVQLWLNNKFACELTTNFVYGPDAEVPSGKTNQTTGQTGVGTTICTVSNAVSVRSAVDTDTQLSGYKRVTPDDFENVVTTYSAAGCNSGSSHTGGAYTGDASDLAASYLDVDIKAANTTNPILTWLSKGSSLYGDGDQLRIYLSGTTLTIAKIHGGSNSGTVSLGDISVAPYNYSADEFFNLKIITDIYGANSIGLVVFVNDTYLGRAYINTYDADTIANMNGLGIHRFTYRRTPLNNKWLTDVLYDLANGNYTLSSAFSFKVNGVAVAGGTALTEPGNYVLEYLVDGETTGYQSLSLYRWGDANGDNVFDIRDCVRYKLYEVDQANMNNAGMLGVRAVYYDDMRLFSLKIAKMCDVLIGYK